MDPRHDIAAQRLLGLRERQPTEAALRALSRQVGDTQRSPGQLDVPAILVPHTMEDHLNIVAVSTIILTAGGGFPTTTAGCTKATSPVEQAAQRDDWTLTFADAAISYAFWNLDEMPPNYDGGGMVAEFVWYTATGVTTEDAVWGMQCTGLADDALMNTALGTVQEVTSAAKAAGATLIISDPTPLITPGGTPAGGNRMRFVARRNGTSGSDDLTDDAELLGVRISYNTLRYTNE